mgnify:CR=1 FL=1
MNDEELEKILMRQYRPSIPHELAEAREKFEEFLVPALLKDMSPPEARVQATILRTQFENVAAARGEREGRERLRRQLLSGGLEELFSDEEIGKILRITSENRA